MLARLHHARLLLSAQTRSLTLTTRLEWFLTEVFPILEERA
jgi:hypothetical protein